MDAAEKFTEIKNKEIREKANTIFNEVRQFAYLLEAKEREILLIQQLIQTNIERYLRELSLGYNT